MTDFCMDSGLPSSFSAIGFSRTSRIRLLPLLETALFLPSCRALERCPKGDKNLRPGLPPRCLCNLAEAIDVRAHRGARSFFVLTDSFESTTRGSDLPPTFPFSLLSLLSLFRGARVSPVHTFLRLPRLSSMWFLPSFSPFVSLSPFYVSSGQVPTPKSPPLFFAAHPSCD